MDFSPLRRSMSQGISNVGGGALAWGKPAGLVLVSLVIALWILFIPLPAVTSLCKSDPLHKVSAKHTLPSMDDAELTAIGEDSQSAEARPLRRLVKPPSLKVVKGPKLTKTEKEEAKRSAPEASEDLTTTGLNSFRALNGLESVDMATFSESDEEDEDADKKTNEGLNVDDDDDEEVVEELDSRRIELPKILKDAIFIYRVYIDK